MQRTRSEQVFIFDSITSVLRRHGLGFDSPVRPLLDASAMVVGTRNLSVQARGASGETVSLDDRVQELKADPRYADLFPNPPRVPHTDMARLKAAFNEIARGTTVVE